MAAEVTYHDRTLIVSLKQIVKTDWVPLHRVRLACPAPMAVGDVERAFKRVLDRGGENGGWPPPVGHWLVDDNVFVIDDGRHEFVASLMHGQYEIFVAWVEER
jgi:hypothetical protein